MDKPKIDIIESHGKTFALEYCGNSAITIWERDSRPGEGWWFLHGTVYLSDRNPIAGRNKSLKLEDAYNDRSYSSS